MNILIGILDSLLILASFFLVCLVLIQLRKRGGLAGAFGGVGGSSAFGTKAGDVFTQVTMSVAAFWIVLCMLMVILSNRGETPPGATTPPPSKVTKSASGSRPRSQAASTLDLSPRVPLPARASSWFDCPLRLSRSRRPRFLAPIPPTTK